MRLFGRGFLLEIGDDLRIEEQFAPGGSAPNTSLRVVFDVVKGTGGYWTRGRFDIYNMSLGSQEIIQEFIGREGTHTITFSVGYGGALEQLIRAELRNQTHVTQGNDTITTLHVSDGLLNFTDGYFSQGFSQGTKLNTIINSIAASMGLVVGAFVGLEDAAVRLRHLALMGKSIDVLRQLGDDYGFTWHIVGSTLEVVAFGSIIEDVVVALSPATGMIGSPSVTEHGVIVKSLLNPQIAPGRKITVESRAPVFRLANLGVQTRTLPNIANGDYKVNKVVHTGDTRGNEWYSTVTAIDSRQLGALIGDIASG